MFENGNGPSLSDIAAVTNNDSLGGNNGWWILIILFAIFGGFGGGYGYNGRSNSGAIDNYVLSSDFASLQRQIDSATADIKQQGTAIANGISSLGYDQLNQMNGINTNINNLGYQLQQCCCENKQAIAQVRYDMATGNCAITNAINTAAQQIMQNDNANYRSLHDENVAMQMEAKNTRIAELQAQIQTLNLAASQQAQNAYLISQLGGNNGCSGCNC